MRFHRTPVAAAVTVTLLGLMAQAHAQQAGGAAPAAQTIEVTGIRAALQKSIQAKQDADTNVEVVTAEDIGKMPDKNIADALSRLPGVNVQYGGALAMDEAERASIRGLSPNLNLVTVNGHALSSGDWHVGDQGSSGRSVGFGLMPSQLIGQAFVYKTSRADMTEGGLLGGIDVRFRKPLDFKKPLTGEVSLGAVHATLPGTTDPQVSGLVSWKNADNTFGVLVQAYKEDRHLRRDGQETFSFGVISAAQATASGDATLAGKRMPGSLNSALFEGVRERTGGYVGLQWKPNKDIELGASAFHTTLNANNYNSSAFALPTTLVANGWLIKNYTVEGDVITKADLVRPAPSAANANQRVIGFQFDHNVREGAESLSSFYDFDAKVKVNDQFTLTTRVGYTEGSGVTNSQPSLTFGLINPNMSYQINTGRPTDYNMVNAVTGAPIDLSKTSSYSQMSNVGASVASRDDETYFHLDGDYKLKGDVLTNIKFGVRNANHKRTYDVVAPRWNAQDLASGLPVSPSPFVSVTGGLLVNKDNLPVYPGTVLPTTPNIVGTVPTPATAYPANWGSGLDAAFPRQLFRFDPAQIQAFADQYVKWDETFGKTWTSGYTVKENNQAAYAMGEFDMGKLTGNAGVRLATTSVYSLSYQALPSGTAAGQCVPTLPCSVPNAIVGSRFATYIPQVTETEHHAVLPSLNLRYEVQKGVIARFGLNRAMGRPNYNELAGAVSLNNTLLTGTSGNPLLKPITATNADATLQWYFAPRAYASVGVFSSSLKDYVKAGTSQVTFFNTSTGTDTVFTVTSRRGVGASLKGAEFAVEMPVGAGFGFGANATYVDSKDEDGVELLGASKWTANLRGFFESDAFTASLAYNYRTDYAIGFVGNGTNVPLTSAGVVTQVNGLHKYKGSGTVSASVGYRFNKDLSIHLDGNNLNDPVRSTYFLTENAPGYWHQSGRQYFLNVRMKF